MDPEGKKTHSSPRFEIGKGVLLQRASVVAIGLFSLPVGIRNNIYRRVLVVPYPLYLFQETGS
jgi:hypothetical protein